jgi:1-phosphofructokinase family hexose kinase
MILCVTLNACLDKTLTVPEWRPGDSVRGQGVSEVVGGKGNNVARALVRLGRSARPVTFLGGHVGARCEELLRRDDGLDPLVIPIVTATREIVTVRTAETSEQTAFFDPDPEISTAEADSLAREVEKALSDPSTQALTLSGSSPSRSTHGLYSDLIALGRARKIPVFLDTYGPALDAVWGFWPDSIQLNRREATAHLKTTNPSESDLLGLLESWSRHGVRCGVVTDGAKPALAVIHGRRYRIVPPELVAVNPIGSGDCLLAGLADAWLSGLPPEGLLRHAFACAVANSVVWEAGHIELAEVNRRADSISVTPISRG